MINGHFDATSPWKKRVTLSKPLGSGPVAEHVAMRNGENAWIMLVERAVRAETR